jgi:periplasmic copper chaperone A
MMRAMAALGLAGVLLTGCGADAPEVTNAWVRLPAVTGRPAAAYFTLAAADQPRVLTAVRSSIAGRTELHESMAHGAGMTMRPLARVPVPAGQALSFAPGGKHVMLFDISADAKPGTRTTLTLEFADRSVVNTPAEIRGAGDPAP